VYPPPTPSPKPVLQFLGGAFIGATPDVFYSHFFELLTSAGFLVVAAPYNVTFDHTACVEEVRESLPLPWSTLRRHRCTGGQPGAQGEIWGCPCLGWDTATGHYCMCSQGP